MKRAALMVAFSFAFASALAAQAQDKPGDKPAADQAEMQAEKPEAEAKAGTQKKKPASRRHHSRRMEDARHCLDKPTNTEIIKCAEAYL